MMPCWSADGETLEFSNSSQGYSIWLTSLDGESQEGLSRGWGGQISPDGKRIAYRLNGIEAMEIISGDVIPLLDREANPYQSIYWNSACTNSWRAVGVSRPVCRSTGRFTPGRSPSWSLISLPLP
jgi:hypothetical protein